MRAIFLLDIDCFFAPVETTLHPELRGRPLAIGGVMEMLDPDLARLSPFKQRVA